MRTGRQAGLIAWRAQSPIARAPRVRRARSNWRRFQRLRPACSRRCSVGMTLTGAPSQRSAAAAAIGAAVQRVCGGAGCGTRARARPPSRRTVATPSMLAQVMTAPSTVPTPDDGAWKWPAGGSSGQAIGTTRSTKTPAFCSAASSSSSQALSTAAIQVGWPATASGATARWTFSASSSSASSTTPTSAMRKRDAGAFGKVMRCQLTSASWMTAITTSASAAARRRRGPARRPRCRRRW